MEFKNTAEVLYAQAKEIVDLIAKIEASEDMHSIDLDLLLEKLRNIYDLISDMKATIPVKNKPDKPEITKKVIEKELSPKSESMEKSSDKKDEAKANKETKQDKGSNGASDKASYVADRFKSSMPTVNEGMADKSKKDMLSSQLNLTPINSISGAIALNEKFELISELFAGDKNKFENTLEVLNQADSFVEAYNYLNNSFDWDMDSVYVQRILELIRRKLIVRRNDQ